MPQEVVHDCGIESGLGHRFGAVDAVCDEQYVQASRIGAADIGGQAVADAQHPRRVDRPAKARATLATVCEVSGKTVVDGEALVIAPRRPA